MQRDVTARIALEAAGPAQIVLAIAVAHGVSSERLLVTQDGQAIAVQELEDVHGGRRHIIDVEAGPLTIEYEASVTGEQPPAESTPADSIQYLRPSRYCESDTLRPLALAQFGGLSGKDLLDAVSSWVGTSLAYRSGASRPTDGAMQTLLAREGVCRDFAHLVVALLRAADMPARVVSVYAPGLDPMDFHAVAEAEIDGEWHVVDATCLAPRQTLLRISTGRDAADTAFISSTGADLMLTDLEVTAVVDVLPVDDLSQLVELR